MRDNFILRKNNLVFFTTQQGKPCDGGARAVEQYGRLPVIKGATLGRAHVTREGHKYLVALVIKDRVSQLTQAEYMKEALHSLLDVVN